MTRASLIACSFVLAWGSDLFAAAATAPTTQPITTAKFPVGDLLRKWWAEGTAAGNVDDIYDNRDRTHSELDRKPFPQLTKLTYTKEQLDIRFDWAAQRVIIPRIVFGNSSTSAPILQGGSNVRMYYTHPRGLEFLYQEYTHNNLYIYPEHQDHDPGHNGLLPDGTPGGHGDVYPTNTPYLITSQGSSGSDQPFMRAIPYTLAAFRPEVKKKLAETGLLMPTIQMLMRSTMKNIKDPAQYLTAIAHPTVFEGANVDDLKMVQAAHAITLEAIPPMIQIAAVEESEFENNRDFFEAPTTTEKHADTPCVIARIWRAAAGKRKIVISAEKSYDINKRPLTFKWVVFRAAENSVKITPLNDAGSKVEISLLYPKRAPIAPGAQLESNRIDIGAFVNNGANWSAPAFITYFSLDSESRKYDEKNNITEIEYGVGSPQIKISKWDKFFEALAADKPAPAIEALKNSFKPEEIEALIKLGETYREKSASKDEKIAKEARELLEKQQPTLSASAKRLIEPALQRLVDAKKISLDPAALPPGVSVSTVTNYVDPNIARPKKWRDVYHYNESGDLTGWTRYGLDQTYEFSPKGQVVLKRDDAGNPLQTANVRYEQPSRKPGEQGPNWNPLKQIVEQKFDVVP